MKHISNRTELRWALEDLGDNGKPILQYLQGYFEFADAVAVVAKSVATDLHKTGNFCRDQTEDMSDWHEVGMILEEAADDLDSVAGEYEKC